MLPLRILSMLSCFILNSAEDNGLLNETYLPSEWLYSLRNESAILSSNKTDTSSDRSTLKLIEDLLSDLLVKELVILTSDSIGMDFRSQMMETYHKHDIMLTIWNIKNITMSNSIESILNADKQLGALNSVYMLYFVSHLSETFEFFTRFSKMAKSVSDRSSVRWIVFGIANDEEELKHFWNKTDFIKCKIVFVRYPNHNTPEDCEYKIYGISKHDLYCKKKKITTWKPHNRAFLPSKLFPTPKFGSNIKGMKLKMAVSDVYPFSVFETTRDGKQKLSGGVNFHLMNYISNNLNFNFEMQQVNKVGGRNETGYWTGMIGLVSRKKVDIAIGAITITNEREHVVDFTHPYYSEKLSFVSGKPEEIPKYLAIVRPLDFWVWMSLIALVVFISLFVYVLQHLSARLYCSKPMSFSSILLNLFGTLACQGVNKNIADHKTTRLLVGFWWFATIITLTTYCAFLNYFILIPGRMPALETINQLHHSVVNSQVRCGATQHSSTYMAFTTSKQGLLRDLGEIMKKEENHIQDLRHGLLRVKKENFVYITDETICFVYGLMSGADNYHFSKDSFYTTNYGIALQDGSPLRDLFNQRIRQALETGLIVKWSEDKLFKLKFKKRYSEKSTVTNRVVTLLDICGVFYMLLFGYSASLLVLFFEIICGNIGLLLKIIRTKLFGSTKKIVINVIKED